MTSAPGFLSRSVSFLGAMMEATVEDDMPRDRQGVDRVNHPQHYTSHPSGVECITVVEQMGFCLGNAIKYIWRADLKGDAIEDLRKARFYIDREIERRQCAAGEEER